MFTRPSIPFKPVV